MNNQNTRDILEETPKTLEQSKKSEGYFAQVANALKNLFVDVNNKGYPNLDRVKSSKAIALTPDMIVFMRNQENQEHTEAFVSFNKLHHTNGRVPLAGDMVLTVPSSLKRMVMVYGEDATALPPRIRDSVFNKLKLVWSQDETIQQCTPDNTRLMPQDHLSILQQPPPQDPTLEQLPA